VAPKNGAEIEQTAKNETAARLSQNQRSNDRKEVKPPAGLGAGVCVVHTDFPSDFVFAELPFVQFLDLFSSNDFSANLKI
jgi:hypothetical protein